MMNKLLRHLVLIIVAATSLCAHADSEPLDTVYFYDTWEEMLEMSPSWMLINPEIEAFNPYEIYIYTSRNDIHIIDHLAATLGDSIWLMSAKYLNDHFKGANKLGGDDSAFFPVFFNDKIAYVLSPSLGIKDFLFGPTDVVSDNVDYYYLDFQKHELRKVTSSVLSELLEDYHDLQMRYEGMKDYKKRYMIEEFFMKYIDRASQDFMRPYIVDLVE